MFFGFYFRSHQCKLNLRAFDDGTRFDKLLCKSREYNLAQRRFVEQLVSIRLRLLKTRKLHPARIKICLALNYQ
ncbi:hypothetical protein CCR84_09185 [Rhodocyclus purpureus]|nr:hypothetical protein [Rhodocyclus purpureus]